MFGIMACAVVLARVVQLPGIVGAFLAGLAVNSAVKHAPAKEKLEFMGNAFFIPIFFVVTGFLIDPACGRAWARWSSEGECIGIGSRLAAPRG